MKVTISPNILTIIGHVLSHINKFQVLSERFHFTDILIRIKLLRLQRVKTIQNHPADSRF